MLDFFKIKKQAPVTFNKSTPIGEADFVVIDTELTGLNHRKDAIISIGAVRMHGMRIELGNAFYRLVKPEAVFKPESVVIHGITPSDVREARQIDKILAEFIDFCGDNIIVGHCVLIDMNFIKRDMKRNFGSTIPNPVIDTFQIYEWLRLKRRDDPCFSFTPKEAALYEIAQRFSIPVRGAHDAIIDAFITAQLFQRFIPLLGEADVLSIGELCTLGNPEGGDLFRKSGDIANF